MRHRRPPLPPLALVHDSRGASTANGTRAARRVADARGARVRARAPARERADRLPLARGRLRRRLLLPALRRRLQGGLHRRAGLGHRARQPLLRRADRAGPAPPLHRARGRAPGRARARRASAAASRSATCARSRSSPPRSRTRSATRSRPRRAWCSRWARTRRRARTSSTRKVALEELDRVERSVAHLLRFAREEEMRMTRSAPRRRDLVGASRRCAIAPRARRRARRPGRRRLRAARRRREAAPRADQPGRQRARRARRARTCRSRASRSTAGENLAGTECWVRVRDNGPGIPAGGARQDLQPLLHLEGARHRARARDLEEAGRRARRRDRGGLHARRGRRVHAHHPEAGGAVVTRLRGVATRSQRHCEREERRRAARTQAPARSATTSQDLATTRCSRPRSARCATPARGRSARPSAPAS